MAHAPFPAPASASPLALVRTARSRRAFLRLAMASAVAGALLAGAERAGAVPALGLGGGSDWYAGPGGERVGSLLGFVAAGDDRASLALGGLRYDDNLLGMGSGALAVIRAPLGARAAARAWATRFVGDGSYRSWRLKAGPELALPPRGATLGLFFQHDEDDRGGLANGGSAELGVPCAAGLTARLTGGLASVAGGEPSSQGTIGLTWQPRSRFELNADIGLARNGAFSSAPLAASASGGQGILGLPLPGGPSNGPPSRSDVPSSTRTEGLMTLGLRAYFP